MDSQPTSQPTPSTPVVPVPVSVPSHSKLPPLLGGTALLILVGAGGIFLGKQMATQVAPPTPIVSTPTVPVDPTANWEIFINDGIGFSVNYPNEFKITTQDKTPGIDLPSTLLALEKQNSFTGYNLTTRYIFQVQKIPNLKTPKSCYIKSNDSSQLTTSKVINGKTFYYSEIYGGAAAGTHDQNLEYKVFLDKENTCLEIDLRYFESSDWNDPKEFDIAKTEQESAFSILNQILSTFKFTQTSTSSETSVQMAAYNNSGESGTAVITNLGDGRTKVIVNIENMAGKPPANIFSGSCDHLGQVKHALAPLSNGLQTNIGPGTSQTILSVSLAELKNELPLAIGVTYSGLNSAIVSCGEIK